MNSNALLREVSLVGNPITMDITNQHLAELVEAQVNPRRDWPAVFSTNCYGELWLYVTNGLTRQQDRIDVRGRYHILDEVRDEYLRVRPEGGRFFINESGAYWKPNDASGQKFQFVRFRFRDDMRVNSRPFVIGFVHGR